MSLPSVAAEGWSSIAGAAGPVCQPRPSNTNTSDVSLPPASKPAMAYSLPSATAAAPSSRGCGSGGSSRWSSAAAPLAAGLAEPAVTAVDGAEEDAGLPEATALAAPLGDALGAGAAEVSPPTGLPDVPTLVAGLT